MCGISGIVSLNNIAVDYQQLVDMTAEMNKRGPDCEGFLISNNQEYCRFLQSSRRDSIVNPIQHNQHIGLGHRRLSITDLSSAASQPMTDAHKRYWIVFNGQIYNHSELRTELEELGYKFNTDHSDTEVILNAYAHWGIDCLEKMLGTWAFCLWDSRENSVFIARDRVGVRPLYYTVNNNSFYFASELNALVTNKNLMRQLDERAVYDYLTYTNVPAPNSVLKHIKKVPAAHYLFFKPGEKLQARRYWSPITKKPLFDLSEKQILDELRDKIYEATRIRMLADVNVGVLLSGGLDSSIILACMHKYASEPVKTYTVGFENKNNYKNEFSYAKKVASHFKADHTELAISEKEFFEFLPQMAYIQDEPIADTANIPIHFIAKVANRDERKVMLGGEGSDELFIGYEHWRLIHEYEKIFRNRPRLASLFSYAHKNSFLKNKRTHYQTWAYKTKNNWPTFWGGTELRTEAEKHKILTGDFLQKLGDYSSFNPISELYDGLIAQKPYDTFDWMMLNDLQNRLPDQLLARLDRMMMSASIEGRHPFLDLNVIEFASRIPSRLKVKQRTEKYLVKKAFEGILPHEIVYRAKDSFTVPLNELFKKEARKKEYLDVIETFNKNTGIFIDSYIKQLHLPQNTKEFWNVLNLAMWYNCHK
jgi:asparagine synthase (glutamine-hydrolysing)